MSGRQGLQRIVRSAEPGLPVILLLASDLFAAHTLRVRARQAGLAAVFDCTSTAAEFLHRLASRPQIVVCCTKGLRMLVESGLISPRNDPFDALEDVFGLLAEHGTSVFVVARDSEEDRATLSRLQGRIANSLRVTQLDWLPMFIERELSEQGARRERELSRQETEKMALVLKESQKLLTVGRLAGEIAHEINNPLEAVTNLLYLMALDTELSESTRSYLITAQRELQRVTVISKQTLNFYRETQVPQRVRLSDLLEEVLVLFGRRLDAKKLTVTRRYESEETVLVFPGEMRQIFSNLVANAMDACSQEGRLVLRVHPGRKWSDAGVLGLRITIADSGAGMPEAVRRKLGRPFFTTKGQRGTGLGLWVSKAIIERYGGELRLRSSTAAGRSGTTFSIFLPTNLRPHIVGPPPGNRVPPAGDPVQGRTGEAIALRASAAPDEQQHPGSSKLGLVPDRDGGSGSGCRLEAGIKLEAGSSMGLAPRQPAQGDEPYTLRYGG